MWLWAAGILTDGFKVADWENILARILIYHQYYKQDMKGYINIDHGPVQDQFAPLHPYTATPNPTQPCYSNPAHWSICLPYTFPVSTKISCFIKSRRKFNSCKRHFRKMYFTITWSDMITRYTLCDSWKITFCWFQIRIWSYQNLDKFPIIGILIFCVCIGHEMVKGKLPWLRCQQWCTGPGNLGSQWCILHNHFQSSRKKKLPDFFCSVSCDKEASNKLSLVHNYHCTLLRQPRASCDNFPLPVTSMWSAAVVHVVVMTHLDRVEFVDPGSEVVGVTSKGDVQGLQELVHPCQQWLGPVTQA